MDRSSATREGGAAAAPEPAGSQHPLQPVRAGGAGRPIALALTIGALLVTLVWQPWGRGASPVASPTPAPVVEAGGPSATPGSAPGVSREPGPSAATTPVPRPTARPTTSAVPGSGRYVSLVDNEWTVVAFLAPVPAASTDEPWTPDGTGATPAPAGPLLVLQQGLDYSVTPLERPDKPDLACQVPGGPRLRSAVPLPAGRVAFLGVTFPGMDPRARVSATVLDRAGVALRRVPSLIVPLSGMSVGRRYTVPSSGSGGAVLFAMATPRFLPTSTYRFDIVTPGITGHHYLYACIGT